MATTQALWPHDDYDPTDSTSTKIDIPLASPWPKLQVTSPQFNRLGRALGLSPHLEFYDLLSIDDSEILKSIPRPVHAVIITFPSNPVFERSKEGEQLATSGIIEHYNRQVPGAEAFYALLHAAVNTYRNRKPHPDRLLGKLLANHLHMTTEEANRFLHSPEVRDVYEQQVVDKTHGHLHEDLAHVPEDDDDEAKDVLEHVCIVLSERDSKLYELDSRREGPLCRGDIATDDLLCKEGLPFIKQFLSKAGLEDLKYSMMVLAPVTELHDKARGPLRRGRYGVPEEREEEEDDGELLEDLLH